MRLADSVAVLDLAEKAGLTPDVLADVIEMSRFTRIRGVAATRARLYRDCVGTLEDLAALQPEQLVAASKRYLTERDLAWIPPTPKEAAFTAKQALLFLGCS